MRQAFHWLQNYLHSADFVLDSTRSRCYVAGGADVSNNSDCIGCWRSIHMMTAAEYFPTGSDSLQDVFASVMIFLAFLPFLNYNLPYRDF